MKKLMLCLALCAIAVPYAAGAKKNDASGSEIVEIRGVAYDKGCMLERVVACVIPEKAVKADATEIDGKAYANDCIVSEAFECAK
jgi:hypothetical protein